MVWVYDRTGSVLVAMLMHVSLTSSLLILNPLGIAGARLQIFSFAFAAAVWLAVAVLGRQSRFGAGIVSMSAAATSVMTPSSTSASA